MFPGGNFGEQCTGCKLVRLWDVGDGQALTYRELSPDDWAKFLNDGIKVQAKDLRGPDKVEEFEPQAGGSVRGGSWWQESPRERL